MRAYSLDFREKIIHIYFTERMSVRKVAKLFGVATSFVEKLLKQLRETGDILPKPHAGGPEPKLNGSQLNLVKALVEADNDATLDQLRQRLADETSVSISRATMGWILQQIDLTRKKNTPRHGDGESKGTTSPGRLLATHPSHPSGKPSVYG
jgi:transposase